MTKKYSRLTLEERKSIEECLNRGISINKTARVIERSPSTVLREICANKVADKTAVKLVKCFCKTDCNKVSVCKERCINPGILCKTCKLADCRKVCTIYAEHSACAILSRAPFVCNHCKHRRYRCGRAGRYHYDAVLADALSRRRRSDARCGIDMEKEKATRALERIKEGLCRGLSPYELSVLYESELSISRSTIYRWVDKGYGGLSNIDLERKVGFRPRKKDSSKKRSSHSSARCYEAFCRIDKDIRASCMEMDTVVGRRRDDKVLLTLYHRPSDLQLALLLKEKTCVEVKRVLLDLKKVVDQSLFERLFRCVLTDNGEEFSDEEGIGEIFGEGEDGSREPRLYYCDVRASQQKGSCEKNHSELRQIIKKGLFSFNELTQADLVVMMSHANSNPREALCGMSPIQMFVAAYGKKGQDLLDALGIESIDRDRLRLTPEVLDIERKLRGEEMLTRLR